MKTKILVAFLLISGLSTFAQTKSISVNMNLRGRGCGHTMGNCHITQTTKNAANSEIYLNENGVLVFEMQTDKFSEEDLKFMLNDESFRKTKTTYIFDIKVDFVLDKVIRDELGLFENIGIIPKGKYPAQLINDKLIIELHLVNIDGVQNE